MRRHGLIHGHRGAALGASVAVLCLGGVLAACGGEAGDDGYAAVGAAGSSPDRAAGKAVPPDGEVELVPLDDDGARGGDRGGHPAKGEGSGGSSAGGTGKGASGAAGADDGGSGGDAPDRGAPGSPGKPGGPGGGASAPGRTGGGAASGTSGGPTAPGSPGSGSPGTGSPGTGPGSPPTTTPPPPPPAPAALKVGAPARAGAGKRWCEKVTVRFSNTGGSPVRSGTVTFATHIIGALGVDWGTRYSAQPLPGPIAAGAAVNNTYTVCVDSWRVPLGMRVETRDVTADWK
ncbi:hypothetical protein [Streptomyces sp. H27-C3]|uniref:hypothetical protein n=1 Tax=Streptomyces sp. H27-C3 TaxID=3046305 RepID=UPI0024BA7F16|nr:hypothetical protein [Streptomyces sp. H27-C3]MDJ0463469.1 hypothetical protein [Streptomyces sp. H27-C3]